MKENQMKRAILYIRVASSFQDDINQGFTQQQIQLETYCKLNGIEVVHTFKEQAGGTTLNRMVFNELIAYSLMNHSHIDLLLFTDWSRILRGNTHQLFSLVDQLERWNIEPRPIFQSQSNGRINQLMKSLEL